MNKTFERQGRTISLALKKKGQNVIIIGTTKKDGKDIMRTSVFPPQKAEKAFSLVTSFEAAEKLFYHLGTSSKPELQNPRTNPSWEKLKAVCAPKEGPDETYIFDEESSGIYTPVLEGIAHKNPKRPTTDGYMKLAAKEHDDFHRLKVSKPDEALRALMRCYRLYDLASHVAYLHNAKKLKGEYGSSMKVVQNLLKLQDEKVTRLREDIYVELEEFKGDLVAKGENELVRKIENEFTLTPHTEKESKESRKVVRRTLAEQVKVKAERYEENKDRLKKLEDSIEDELQALQKAVKRGNLHDSDKEFLESRIDSLKRHKAKLEKQVEKDQEIVEAVVGAQEGQRKLNLGDE